MATDEDRLTYLSADEAVRLIADELGIDIPELERKRQAKIEAEEQERIRRRCEAEEETRRRQEEARQQYLESVLASGRVRAWKVGLNGKRTEVRHLKDLVCPECGEVPPLLAGVIQPFHEAITGHSCGTLWFDRGNLGPRANVCRVPAFSITAACPCGAEITFEAVCLPKDG